MKGRELWVGLLGMVLVLTGCPDPSVPSDGSGNPGGQNTVSLLDIPGVAVPVTAATASQYIDTNQYQGEIEWSPTLVNGAFAPSTVYTATITLVASFPLTFEGLAPNRFRVAGATEVTHPANSGVVTAVFPRTGGAQAVSLTMISVPAGRFQREANTASITGVSAFSMSAHEITTEQFMAVTGLPNPSNSFATVVNGPVQKVTWYHTLVFCNSLSLLEDITPVYSINGSTDPSDWGPIPDVTGTAWDDVICNWNADGYRLPTEMEWMWAAMGAPEDGRGEGVNTTGHEKGYAGSEELGNLQALIGSYAWSAANSSDTTHPVGQKTANQLGLYDMSGNVWEWCWDWHAPYPGGTITDYRGPAWDPLVTTGARTARGGSWETLSNPYLRIAYRSSVGFTPGGVGSGIGFRVVRSN